MQTSYASIRGAIGIVLIAALALLTSCSGGRKVCLTPLPSAPFYGRILERTTHEPVIGAEIHFRKLALDRFPCAPSEDERLYFYSEPAPYVVAYSDSAGEFDLWGAEEWMDLEVTITATGCETYTTKMSGSWFVSGYYTEPKFQNDFYLDCS